MDKKWDIQQQHMSVSDRSYMEVSSISDWEALDLILIHVVAVEYLLDDIFRESNAPMYITYICAWEDSLKNQSTLQPVMHTCYLPYWAVVLCSLMRGASGDAG